jgi:predicted PurR-regulated permease PerM
MNSQARFPYVLRLACIFIVIVLLVTTLYYAKVVLVPMLFAIIFAVMLFPFSIRLEKWGFGKGLASFTAVFITTIFLGFLVYLLFNQISSFITHAPQLSNKMDSIVNSIRDFATEKFHLKKTVVADKIHQQLNDLENSSGILVSGLIANLPGFLINLFMVPLYVFFLLYYRHFFLEFFYKIFHSSDKTDIDETLANLNLVIRGYVFGQFLDIIIIGFINTITLYLIGIGYPIVLGFGIAVLCIIPYLGMIAGSIVALLVALLTTTTSWQPFTALAALWVIHIIDSNVVAPYVIGSRINLNPLVAIIVLILFGELWGTAGLFLAFPLAAILKVIFDKIPGLKPYGFLLGEPQKYHLKKYSLLHLKRVQNIQELREQSPLSEVLPGEPGADPLPGDVENSKV